MRHFAEHSLDGISLSLVSSANWKPLAMLWSTRGPSPITVAGFRSPPSIPSSPTQVCTCAKLWRPESLLLAHSSSKRKQTAASRTDRGCDSLSRRKAQRRLWRWIPAQERQDRDGLISAAKTLEQIGTVNERASLQAVT